MSRDTLFVNGTWWSAGMGSSAPGAVAVRSGRVSAVGAEEELLEAAAPGTEVVDLAGGLLLPGFQDAHVHPVMAGVDLLRCDLHGCTSAEEALAVIAAYAAANPDLVGRRRRLVDGALRRRHADRAAARQRGARPARRTSRTATATAPG